MNTSTRWRLGVDLGGTKTEVAALAPDGRIATRRRAATPRHDYSASLRQIRELVLAVEAEIQATGSVGVAMPGSLSPVSGRVQNANSTWLNGRTLDRDLIEVMERPVRLANDADCFALSEASDGAAAGAAVVFGVIAGTGTGGGVVVNGQLLPSRHRIAGEWGHCQLPWPEPGEIPGPACYCGLHGCIETWLSGPGLADDHRRHTGEDLTAAAIHEAAMAGEPAARASLARHASRFARGLAMVINILDPEVIVLGGGLSKIHSLYQEIPRRWNQYIFADQPVSTRLLPPLHGDSSGVRGAAWLWPPEDN